MRRCLPLVVLGLVLLIEASAAGEIQQKKEEATLDLRFDGNEPVLALPDLLTVTLTIEGPAGFRVRAPQRFPGDYPWLLVESTTAERKTLPSARESWRLTYKFAPRAPGKEVLFHFPDIQVRHGETESDEKTIKWSPVSFTVNAAITDPERAALRDITAIETLPDPPKVEAFPWHWLVALGALFLVVLLVLGVRCFLRRAHVRNPAQFALYEWHRLQALKLPEQGRGERHITLLTWIVQQFLERQFSLPARRRTTPEFVRDLAQHAMLPEADKEFLTAFFRRAETIKFAHADVTPEECGRWSEAVRQFLERHLKG